MRVRHQDGGLNELRGQKRQSDVRSLFLVYLPQVRVY